MASLNPKRIPSPRTCVFCENAANSKEHFWPEWMHPLIGKKDSASYEVPYITYAPWEGRNVTSEKPKPGDLLTLKIRRVCAQCNSGWMSLFENAAMPFLKPMVLGQSVILSGDDAQVLARWVTMKCMVLEHLRDDTYLAPKIDRVRLRENGAVPDYYKIYISHHQWPAKRNRSHCIASDAAGPKPPLEVASKNIQTISFIMGDVFVHVNAARIDDMNVENGVPLAFLNSTRRINPRPLQFKYGADQSLTEGEVTEISVVLETLKENFQKVHWVKEIPREVSNVRS